MISLYRGYSLAIDWSASYLISLAFLVLFGSIAAFGAYLTLLGRIGAHKAGYALVMFPVVALVISFFFEGLEPSWNIFLGVSLVLLGNVFVLREKRHAKEPGIDGGGREYRSVLSECLQDKGFGAGADWSTTHSPATGTQSDS